MTPKTIKIGRSGPAIRAALAELSPDECSLFEEQFRQALVPAQQCFDLRPVEAVPDRWWGIATILANPLSPAERELVAGIGAGDDSGWSDGPSGADLRP